MNIRFEAPRRTLTLGVLLAASFAVAALGPARAASADPGDDVVSLTTCVDTPMTLGSNGPCVLSLQHSLAAVGINVLEDGAFGTQTEAAVRGFQSGRPDLDSDGVANHDTIAALDRAANSPQAAEPASTSTAPTDGVPLNQNGVYACGNVTCTLYFSRRATQEVNQLLNDRNTDLSSAAATIRLCWSTGEFGPACDAAVAAGSWLLQGSAQDAVDQGACLKVKLALDGLVPYRSGVDNSASHCIDGDGF